jgi:hypothetical protein
MSPNNARPAVNNFLSALRSAGVSAPALRLVAEEATIGSIAGKSESGWYEFINYLTLTPTITERPDRPSLNASVIGEELTHGAWDILSGTRRMKRVQEALIRIYGRNDYGNGRPAIVPARAANEALAKYAGLRASMILRLISTLRLFAARDSVDEEAVSKALEDYRIAAKSTRKDPMGYSTTQLGEEEPAGVPLPRIGQDYVDQQIFQNTIPDEPTESPVVRQLLRVVKTHPASEDSPYSRPGGTSRATSSSGSGKGQVD